MNYFQMLVAIAYAAFAAEEVWSWYQDGSVHLQPWPTAEAIRAAGGEGGDPAVLTAAGEVLGQVRKAKSAAKTSMRTGVDRLVVRDTAERLALVEQARPDLVNAGVVTDFVTEEGEFDVAVALTDG
jgi:valyl-tRNA synthetase